MPYIIHILLILERVSRHILVIFIIVACFYLLLLNEDVQYSVTSREQLISEIQKCSYIIHCSFYRRSTNRP